MIKEQEVMTSANTQEQSEVGKWTVGKALEHLGLPPEKAYEQALDIVVMESFAFTIAARKLLPDECVKHLYWLGWKEYAKMAIKMAKAGGMKFDNCRQIADFIKGGYAAMGIIVVKIKDEDDEQILRTDLCSWPHRGYPTEWAKNWDMEPKGKQILKEEAKFIESVSPMEGTSGFLEGVVEAAGLTGIIDAHKEGYMCRGDEHGQIIVREIKNPYFTREIKKRLVRE